MTFNFLTFMLINNLLAVRRTLLIQVLYKPMEMVIIKTNEFVSYINNTHVTFCIHTYQCYNRLSTMNLDDS
jgi:hypothetical protein